MKKRKSMENTQRMCTLLYKPIKVQEQKEQNIFIKLSKYILITITTTKLI